MKDFIALLPFSFTEVLSSTSGFETPTPTTIKRAMERDFYDGDGKPLTHVASTANSNVYYRISVSFRGASANPDANGGYNFFAYRRFLFNPKDLEGKLLILGGNFMTRVGHEFSAFKYSSSSPTKDITATPTDQNYHYYEAVFDFDNNTVTVYRDGVVYKTGIDIFDNPEERGERIFFYAGLNVNPSASLSMIDRNAYGSVTDLYLMVSDKSKGHDARLGLIELKRVNPEVISAPAGWIPNKTIPSGKTREDVIKSTLAELGKNTPAQRNYVSSDPRGTELILKMPEIEEPLVTAANLYISVMKDAGSNALASAEITTSSGEFKTSYNPENLPEKPVHNIPTPQITTSDGSNKDLDISDIDNIVIKLKGRAL